MSTIKKYALSGGDFPYPLSTMKKEVISFLSCHFKSLRDQMLFDLEWMGKWEMGDGKLKNAGCYFNYIPYLL
jgi:hypothetical protein